jgi:hypothetical protein
MVKFKYWERLQRLGLYSLQRRRDRYFILYTWKITEMVPNLKSKTFRIETSQQEKGETFKIP